MARRIKVGTVSDFPPGELHAVVADGTPVVLAREGDTFSAARNHCPHLGFSLTKGPGGLKYEDGVVQCPWHNSRFDLCTGANLDWATGFAGRAVPQWSRRMVALGRKPAPLTTYPVVIDGDDVLVEV